MDTDILSGLLVRCGSKNKHKKRRNVQMRLDYVLKYANYSRLNSGDLSDHLMSTRIFTLVMNKIFKSPGNYEASIIWTC